MVSILVVSHSFSLASGVKEIGEMLSSGVVIEAAGGFNGGLGSDYELIKQKLERIYSDDGVLIMADMGSSIMTAQMVIEELGFKRVRIVDGPLVEGVIKALSDISCGKQFDEIEAGWKDCVFIKG